MKNILFKVHVDTCLVVEAPENATDDDIYWITRQAIKDHLADVEESDISFEEIESIKDLPKPWDKDCLPYGSGCGEDRTIGQILGDE